MYLHGFVDPHIYEYDTLASQDKWNEYADVILANPPFMSPKGGIQPHKRFSVQSKRSEVLFVDYMAEHLNPTGRAAIIVPEGIIFQSQTAYKQLRKMLVDDYLVAVVSLPAGVFNPYSGVKTSILILDKTLAKKTSTIAFFKIENDGFGLGAQRRAIGKNDLPSTAIALKAFRHSREGTSSPQALFSMRGALSPNVSIGDGNPEEFDPNHYYNALVVEKTRIAENGDYNLSAERYREEAVSDYCFPLVFLGDASLFRVESGGTPKSDVEAYWNGGIPWATLVDLPATDFISQITVTQRTITEMGLQESSAKMIPPNSIVVSTRATIGRIAINRVPIATNQGFKNVVIEDSSRAIPEYVALALTKLVPTMDAWATGGTFKEISKSKFCELQIPLPPLAVQKEIVAEIDSYQKVIDGARAVLDNYRPHIPIDPDWPMVLLSDVFKLSSGRGLTQTNMKEGGYPVYGGNGKTGTHSEYFLETANIVIGRVGAYCGAVHVTEPKAWITDNGLYITEFKQEIDLKYLAQMLVQLNLNQFAKVGGQPSISQSTVCERTILLPSLATQRAIVAEIEAEQTLVAANRELIARFEKKIQATLARVWGEGESTPAET